MLFKSDLIKLIKTGRKTQTRRAWRSQMVKEGRYYPIMRSYYQKGRDGFILVKKVRKERLGSITDKDALTEGFNSKEEFRRGWTDINKEWKPSKMVYVVDFEYHISN